MPNWSEKEDKNMKAETIENEVTTMKEDEHGWHHIEDDPKVLGGFVWRKDKYDHAIDYLMEHPEDIHDAWADPGSWEGKGGELFGFVAPDWRDGNSDVVYRGEVKGPCGCLQQIRAAKKEGSDGSSGSQEMSHWPRLWESIARDRRLPEEGSLIGIDDLPVFAEWQRKVDIKRAQDGIVV